MRGQHSDSEQLSPFVEAVKRQFAPNGTLSRATDGFVSRPGQVAFAQSVAQAIEQADTLVVEAGTGTGKTFAYLTPALMSGPFADMFSEAMAEAASAAVISAFLSVLSAYA